MSEAEGNVTPFRGPGVERHREELRIVEALLFASDRPLDEAALARHLPEGSDVARLLAELAQLYAGRGVNLVRAGGGWLFRTAPDLAHLLRRETEAPKRLSRAALETLAVIAYHQPVTRAEIEAVRGVAISKGTLDILLETGWVRMRGRRRVPGRPVTFGTTEAFLVHFGLERISDLPGLDDLKAAGLLEATPPEGFRVPLPSDDDALARDEDPLGSDDDLREDGGADGRDAADPETRE